jgi:hypothetical protein
VSPGAALGAAGGALLGEKVAQNAADQNTDMRFRIQQLQKARDEVNARRAPEADDTGRLISFRHGSGKGGTVDTALRSSRSRKPCSTRRRRLHWHQRPPAGVNLPKFLAPIRPEGKEAARRPLR